MAGVKSTLFQPIGILDSGLGGLSVLADMTAVRPGGIYYYLADARYAPYGEKKKEEVRQRTLMVADFLMKKGIKLLLVACNTATSAAVTDLRKLLTIPVVGMEPALKPAVASQTPQTVLVAATPLTLREEKFGVLFQQTKGHHEVIPLPCPGLVEIIEKEGPGSDAVNEKLEELLAPHRHRQIQRLVLGCTHYVLIRPQWQQAAGAEIELVDGNSGTVRQVLKVLDERERPDDLSTVLPLKRGMTHITLITTRCRDQSCQLMKTVLMEQLSQRDINWEDLGKTMQIDMEEECI
jgi:glutamate racemase